MEYIRFTEQNQNDLDKIFSEIDEIYGTEDIEDKLYIIQNKLATLSIELGQEFEILEHEINLGNVKIEDDILTCIHNNKILNYKLSKKKANLEDIVMIINTSESTPFKNKHKNRFFKVTEEAEKDLLKWVVPCVIVGNWCLYGDQYLVLDTL